GIDTQKRWCPAYCWHPCCVLENIQTKSPSCSGYNRRSDRGGHADRFADGERIRVSIGLPGSPPGSPDVEPTRPRGRGIARNVQWSPSRPHRPFADEIVDSLRTERGRPAPTNLDRPNRRADKQRH